MICSSSVLRMSRDAMGVSGPLVLWPTLTKVAERGRELEQEAAWSYRRVTELCQTLELGQGSTDQDLPWLDY